MDHNFNTDVSLTRHKNNELSELKERREKLVEAIRENDFEDGIKRFLTDLYPDNAHFIYELLQNAEDAGASEVRFVLNKEGVTFEHNGDDLFSLKDVDAITKIGDSPKKDDPTSIGKFGIGFKAVFAYTATPEIESGAFHFRIRDMVVPSTEGLAPSKLDPGKTRFTLPFDNPKKPPERAAAEIEENLRKFDESTLLFLSNIRKIEYRLPDLSTGLLERNNSTDKKNRIKISIIRPGNPIPNSTDYFLFTKHVDVIDEDENCHLKSCRIAIAFGTDESGKIIPLNPGKVCIYFPAAKETSNLRFHLHAPFASTVARDSVRECPANNELRDHLSAFIAESMHVVRDQGLLNVGFLATLPNDKDNLPQFYQPIQKRLVHEFNTKKLTPMKREPGEHAAASECYRGRSSLTDLIKDKDLALLLGKKQSEPLWIANPPQINQREDNFLSTLGISQWEIKELIDILYGASSGVTEWLKGKPDEWYQRLYVLLSDFRPSLYEYKLPNLRIVRCNDGINRRGKEAHFVGDDVEPIESQETGFHYVAKGVYMSGKDSNKKEKAREFLEKIGVCKVDEGERIKAILKNRYKDPDTAMCSQLHKEDMERFIVFVEKEPDKASLFEDMPIFKTSEGYYCKANMVFLDLPYLDTDLSKYYEDDKYWEIMMDKCIHPCLALDYEEYEIAPEKLGKFAKAVGAKALLEAVSQSIAKHPEAKKFYESSPGRQRQDTGINEDYRIPAFQILTENPSIDKSKLIWRTMNSLPEDRLKARFQCNQSYPLHEDHSSVVYDLREAKWVPQEIGNSISFVRPCEASTDFLPTKGFPYERGKEWLTAIEFGETAKQQRLENNPKQAKQNLRNQHATEMGFNSADEAYTMADIANTLKEQGKSPHELRDKLIAGKRRKERILIELGDAPEKEYEQRPRSVRITTGTIDRRTHLRTRYTIDDNKMKCQMCRQDMPFKKRNSDEDYFEAVEALRKDHFPKEHEAQHLGLCPECAAKYKEIVKRDETAREALYNCLRNSDVPEVRLELSNLVIYIWFEEKHWQDLKTVLDYYESEKCT